MMFSVRMRSLPNIPGTQIFPSRYSLLSVHHYNFMMFIYSHVFFRVGMIVINLAVNILCAWLILKLY